MENDIRTLLINKLREYHTNFTVPHYDDVILKVVTFNPIELEWKDDLGNISGNASFISHVKGKIKGVAFRNRTYSFSFSGAEAVMDGTKVSDLNIENMNIPSYTRQN